MALDFLSLTAAFGGGTSTHGGKAGALACGAGACAWGADAEGAGWVLAALVSALPFANGFCAQPERRTAVIKTHGLSFIFLFWLLLMIGITTPLLAQHVNSLRL